MGNKLLRHIFFIGIGLYLAALLTISLAFRDFALQLKWMLWGIGEVLFFFLLTIVFYPRWKKDDPKRFKWKIFLVAFVIRGLYAILISYYYYYQTGMALEYNAGDSLWYHQTGVYLSKCVKSGYISYIFKYLNAYTMGYSDQGYTLWLTLIYTIFGRSLLTPRIFKALMSAYLCLLVYKLAKRTFSERVGRLAAVMCVFFPILIQSCGLHTKEMEMIFLSILALERMDFLVRSKKYTFWNIFVPILFTAMTFGFRTIIGMCLIFAFLVFVVLSDKDLVSKKGKIVASAATVVVVLVFFFSPIGREMGNIYRMKFTDIDSQSEYYASIGLKHSELAKSWYLAPGAFVLPLAPMVEESPDHNKMIHGSTYVKNFLAFFAMLAFVIAIRQKKWRDFSLIGAYELSYLTIIMFSFAANSERFHEPAIPLIIVMAAYAMTHMRHKDLKLFHIYCGVLFVALFGWNTIKLSARGFESIDNKLFDKLNDKLNSTQTTNIGHNLPETYQEVEYIEANGTQWINTSIPINPKHTIYYDGCVRSGKMGQLICGYLDKNNRLGANLYGKSNKLAYFWQVKKQGQQYKEQRRSDTKIDVTKRFQSVQSKIGVLYIQGDSIFTDLYCVRNEKRLPDTITYWTIFKINSIDSKTKSMTGVLFEGKIWDDDNNLIAHYIPCYRLTDNEIGLYDLISGVFLSNVGSGTFLKGADIGRQLDNDSIIGYNHVTKIFFSNNLAVK